MPRVKIDYIVSFSSEDAEHQANNLLNWEVSKKKWLCQKGESSCSVVLQLAKAVKISAVHIGAYHAALVEVLVARSETSGEQFQVLVPSSVFVSREESRRDSPVERVRSFSADQLSASARAQRWDRVRVVCSQPYNKHCKYGLSFVHIDKAEEGTAPAVPPRLLTLDTFSSDEEEFKPGELFAKHLQKTSTGDRQHNNISNTGAQIRQATSQALRNISESSTKLMKTPICKPNVKRNSTAADGRNADRWRDTLLYTEDDERPHAKIDNVVQRHKDEKEREEKNKPTSKHDMRDSDKLNDSTQKAIDEAPKHNSRRNKSHSPPRNETPQSRSKNRDKPTSDQKKDKEVRKRRRSNSQQKCPAEASSDPHTILRGVVLVLSGYENPRRANIRNLALALGARVERDWGPSCTHLICAFPNTPKLRAVRGAEAGRVVSAPTPTPAVRGEWVEECSRRRRRLPWRWFATEPALAVTPPTHELDHTTQHPDSEGDTDDEIERVLQEQKKRRLTVSNDTKQTQRGDSSAATADGGRTDLSAADSDRTDPSAIDSGRAGPSAADSGRVDPSTADITRTGTTAAETNRTSSIVADPDEDGTSTDEDTTVAPQTKQFGGSLPDFFDGYTFAIDAEPDDAEQMKRYVRAYGGLVLEISEVEEGSHVDYVVRGRNATTAVGGNGRDVGGSGRDVGGSGRDVGSSGRDVGGSGRDVGGSGRDVGSSGRDVGGSGRDVGGSGRDVGSSGRDVGGSGRDVGGSSRSAGGGGRAVGASWLSRCHAAQALLPHS